MNGFALGGAASGFDEFRKTGIQQQQVDQQGTFQQGQLSNQQKELAIREQAQKNQQQRELYARADKESSQLLSIAAQTIQNAAITAAQNGQSLDISKVTKAIQPLVDQAKSLRKSSGSDPSIIDAMINSQFATVQSTVGGAPSPGKPSAPQSASSTDVGGTAMPPGQNLTGPDNKIVGIDYGPVENRGANGQPVASPASSPVQPAPLPEPGIGYDMKKIQNVLSLLPKDDPRRPVLMAQYQDALRISHEKPQLHTVTSLDGVQKLVTVDRNGVQHDVVDTSLEGVQKAKVEKAFKDDLHGLDFLKALPARDAQYVKGIATYRINPTTSSIRGGRRETVMNWVMQYNPEYNQQVFTSGSRAMSVLGQRIGQMNGAIETAKQTAPRVLETSALVDRTKFKDLNSILLSANERLGDPNVVRFKIATMTLINNYARALGAGTAVLTDSARKEATDILQTAYSKGQMKAAVDQMLVEMDSEYSGTKNALASTQEAYGIGSPSTSKPASGKSQDKVVPWTEFFK